MKVVILGDLFTYPDFSAAAASSRVFAYATGFVKNNVQPTIMTIANIYGYEKIIHENGFECFVALQQIKRNKHFLIRRYYRIKKYLNIIGFIQNKQKAQEPISAFILYTRSPALMIYGKLLAFYFSIKLILEVTEHPLNDFHKYSLWKLVFPQLFYPFFDEFICISNSLKTYCERLKNKTASVIIIPPLIDFTDTTSNSCKPIKEDYLLYSGSLSIHRDGIDNLIKAFHLISSKHKSLQLVLGGKWYDKHTKKEIYNLVAALQLNENITFLDFLPKEKIQAYINNAKILCVARNENKKTSAAFPTKLAEYLATGKPVIVTAVGDISIYLQDGINAFLVEPGNVEAFANKIEYVLENYPIALNVAAEGKALATSCFGNTENVKRLKEFINEFN